MLLVELEQIRLFTLKTLLNLPPPWNELTSYIEGILYTLDVKHVLIMHWFYNENKIYINLGNINYI